jgi:hypothetical protein
MLKRATFRILQILPLVLCLTAGLRLHSQIQSAPIRLSAINPHYFVYQGKTVVLISSGEHYGAVMNLDVDYRRYLQTIEAAGFNYTRLFGGSYIEVPEKSFGILRNDLAPAPGRLLAPWTRSAVPGYAGGGNKFDLDRWDAEYFKRFRAFLAEAEKRGIVVELSLFSAQYNEVQWNVSPFNEVNNTNGTGPLDWKLVNTAKNGRILNYQESYTRKLVHEANAFPNVIFEIQNEPWSDRPVLTDVVNPFLFPPGRDQYPNSIDLPDADAIAWETQVAGWIADEESSLPHKHLIAQNYSNFRLPVRQLIPGVSVVNFHYAYPEAVTLNYGLGRAISYDETGFLGRGDGSYVRQAWNFMLAGGSTFNGLDYSFSPGHEDGTDLAPNGPGGGSPELRRRLHILKDFLLALPLEEMHVNAGLVSHAAGVNTHVLANARGVYAIYLDGDGSTELTLNLPAGKYSAIWVDTESGKHSRTLLPQHQGDKIKLRSPDFKNGIALLLTRER